MFFLFIMLIKVAVVFTVAVANLLFLQNYF